MNNALDPQARADAGTRVEIVDCLIDRHIGLTGTVRRSGYFGHLVELDNGLVCGAALVREIET